MNTHTATRYLVPLKEGGSLPAILDTEWGGMFVTKFRGAGQGARALVAEIIVGRLGQRLGLPIPELALILIDESFGRSEPDPEIQDILKGSRGINVGMRYLAGSFTYDPIAYPDIDPQLAARIVWFDALVMNIDRTPRNSNMLFHEGALWLIDHGAALYFHHNWEAITDQSPLSPFMPIRDHILLARAGSIEEADREMMSILTPAIIEEVVEEIPDELLMDAPSGTEPPFDSARENRGAYVAWFTRRCAEPRIFTEQAATSHRESLIETPREKGYRR